MTKVLRFLLSVCHFGDASGCNATPTRARLHLLYSKELNWAVFTTLWVRVTFRFTARHTTCMCSRRSGLNGGGKSWPGEHRVQIETNARNRVNWHLPANTKGGCLRSAGLIYQTEGGGGGGALPRRTHEILTQFYMTLVLALASPFILEIRRRGRFFDDWLYLHNLLSLSHLVSRFLSYFTFSSPRPLPWSSWLAGQCQGNKSNGKRKRKKNPSAFGSFYVLRSFRQALRGWEMLRESTELRVKSARNESQNALRILIRAFILVNVTILYYVSVHVLNGLIYYCDV